MGSAWGELANRNQFLKAPALTQNYWHLMRAIIGREIHVFTDQPPFLEIGADGHSLGTVIRMALQTLQPTERTVIIQRFGLGKGVKSIGLREIVLTGKNGTPVTHERIRQIEAKALRKLRHPYRTRILTECCHPYNRKDEVALLVRYEIYKRLSEAGVSEIIAYDIAMAIRRRRFREVMHAIRDTDLKRVGALVAASCRFQLGHEQCPLDGNPVLPGHEWCIEHTPLESRGAGFVPTRCDGCGVMFPRRVATITATSRRRGGIKHVFHSRACFGKNAGRLGIFAARSKAKKERDGQ